MPNSENILLSMSFSFALVIIKSYKQISNEHKEYVLSKQLLRSGTAVGALIREAQNAESRKDFIHKLAIAQKECDETIYWLNLLHQSSYLSDASFQSLEPQAISLLKILKRSIITTKSRLK